MLQEFGWEVFEHPAYSPDLPQVILTCSQNWRNFLVADASKAMEKWRMPSRSG
jgi:hypothetical protein